MTHTLAKVILCPTFNPGQAAEKKASKEWGKNPSSLSGNSPWGFLKYAVGKAQGK